MHGILVKNHGIEAARVIIRRRSVASGSLPLMEFMVHGATKHDGKFVPFEYAWSTEQWNGIGFESLDDCEVVSPPDVTIEFDWKGR